MSIQLKVLDLSHHNDGPHGGAIDFSAIANFGIRGIIHKSSQGSHNVDQTYVVRRQRILDAGLLHGAYHFADASDPIEQVRHFLAVAQPDDTTLVALDFEPNGSNTMTLDNARIFLHAMEDALGRKAVLYSGNLIKETLGSDTDEFLAAHRLWLAHYNDHPRWPPNWGKVWLHQFSGDGVNNHSIHVPGVNAAQASQLDMNSYEGTDEDLATEWAS